MLANIEEMMGKQGSTAMVYWKICWKFISPGILIVVFIATLVKYQTPTYEGVPYPGWAVFLGWAMAFMSVIMVPGFAIHHVGSKTNWTFKGKRMTYLVS